ncbi:fructoselysine 3-epimerase [archaeon BMS3Abin17]|nr:fructoselysine 3-epimerase [archaeon BMS3Abin17]HDZ60960.1 sugar phosphate isomerase/epimerase [Candidatus Pacearchaeota archaeon]
MKIGTFIKIGSFPEKFWEQEFSFVRNLKKDGVNHLEISLQYPHTGPSALTSQQIERIKSLKDFELILHPMLHYTKAPETLKGRKFDLASLEEETREFSIEEVMRTYNIAKRLDAKLITVHGGYCENHKSYKKHLTILRKSIESLSKKLRNIKLGIENLPTTDHLGNHVNEIPYYPDDLIFLTKGLDNIGVTLDIGHANTIMKPIDFYKKLISGGINVFDMHIHDNKGYKDSHLPLGQGNIDFKEFIGYLKKEQYERYLTVELDINWGDSKIPSQGERRNAIKFLNNLR